MDRFTVSFDIDETLLHSTDDRRNDDQVEFGPFWTTPRPGLEPFLRSVMEFADVGFYTAASQSYAERFLEVFAPFVQPKFLLTRDRCIVRHVYHTYSGHSEVRLKDLSKVVKHRDELKRLVAVDDLPHIYPRQYSNVVGVPAFFGSEENPLFPRLLSYLRELSALENVRPVEKRYWLRADAC